MPRRRETDGTGDPHRAPKHAAPAIPRLCVREARLEAEDRLRARMMRLPGADEEPDLELSFAGVASAGTYDSACHWGDPVREATVARQVTHQVGEESLVVELDSQRHLQELSTPAVPRVPT